MSATRLLDALAAQGERLVLSDACQQLSAAEVLRKVQALTANFANAQVIAVLADNSAQWVLADLATLAMGAVHLPLPTFFSPEQMVNALTQTQADAVYTDQPERITALNLGFVCEWTQDSHSFLRRPVAPHTLPQNCSKVSFTSGSTGAPKGVCLSASGLMATAQAVQSSLAPLDIQRHLVVLPLSLLLENTAGIYAALLNGSPLHVPPLASLGWRGMAGFDPAALQHMAFNVQPSSMILVPELLKAWLLFLQVTQQRAPQSLRFVAVGGAHVDAAFIRQARQAGIPAYEGYGLTECGSVVSLNLPGDESTGVGRVLPHVHLRLNQGEVLLQTSAFLGYTGQTPSPETTRPAAATHEFATGDLGTLDAQGHLHLMGRSKNLLITSFGRNISPEWVESVLLAQPALLQAVVLGDARPWLVAVLAPMPGMTESHITAAMAHANRQLPDYAQVKHWLIAPPMTLANGLATGNGRPKRSAIAEQFASRLETLYNPPADHPTP